MSIKAIVWAFDQEIKPASIKFVLVAFSDCVSDIDACGYPSIDAICAKTSLDRKTVISAISRLEEIGVIEDTGKRVGRTGQVKVYRLVGMKTGGQHYVYKLSMEETGQFYVGVRSCWGSPHDDQHFGSGAWPTSLGRSVSSRLKKEVIAVFSSRSEAEERERQEISRLARTPGCMNVMIPKAEQYQFSDETVPVFPDNSTVFPFKESQKRDTEPSITVKEPSRNKKAREGAVEIPDWIDRPTFDDFVAMRNKIKKPMTDRAIALLIGKLAKMREARHDVKDVLEQSIINCWQDVYEPKGNARHVSRGKPAFDNFATKDYGQSGDL